MNSPSLQEILIYYLREVKDRSEPIDFAELRMELDYEYDSDPLADNSKSYELCHYIYWGRALNTHRTSVDYHEIWDYILEQKCNR